jgi:alpha-D-ribose 1-methylphosphonate 5-triphosphate synthase subunit PhnH
MLRQCCAAVLGCLLGASSLLSPSTANAQTSVTGQWTKLQTLRMSPIHMHLLPHNGKIMMWGRPGIQEYSWDPVTQAFADLAGVPYDIFCAGHSYLADGRLFVAGGHIADFVGLPSASAYNPMTNTWANAPDMNAGRWYPTVTTLANGDALVVSGQVDTTSGINTLPQVYQSATNSWRSLTGAQLSQPMYPMMFLAPNGKVIDVAPSNVTRFLDTTGTGTWSSVGTRIFGWRDYGSAAMYADGKILVVGGGDPPTATAEVIDLNTAAPAWRAVAPMSIARRQLNATVLPDGNVLVTGGTSGPGHDNATTPVFSAELWNAATETWTTMASMTVPRLYHSVASLLPDGRVLSMGGDGYHDVEVFSPPYLFKGARPAMSGVPATIGYGQRFTVQSPDAAGIQKVTLVRLSSVTHAFDQNQRLNVLQFAPGTGTIDITGPANANIAPPGHYMLFVVNGNGVPSMASVVLLGGAPPTTPPAPALSSLAPNTATAGGPAFTLTVNGTNFVSGATVRWNGAARATTFVSATRLTAAITAADIAAQGTAQVSVLNPSGTASGTLPFSVTAATAPGPVLGSLSPANATAGGPAFTLTVNGSNFTSGSVVLWNGVARTTTHVRGNRLRATITAADIATPGTAQVSVRYASGATSGTLPFTVTGTAATAPALDSLSPTNATAGGPAFTLTVNGSNFVSGSVVRWNGAARTTTFVSATQLRAAIAAADIAAQGTAQVSVLNPSGTASGTLPFTVAAGGGSTFTLSVTRNGTASGNGLITSNPAGISCGASCNAAFASGGNVTLSVATSGGGVFAGWGGACTGTASTCTVSMNANKAVTATINAGGGACVPYPEWDPNLRYVGGEKVTRLGKYYIARVVGDSVWNVNSPPEWTPNYWDLTTCP